MKLIMHTTLIHHSRRVLISTHIITMLIILSPLLSHLSQITANMGLSCSFRYLL